jgi:hypothetical protein
MKRMTRRNTATAEPPSQQVIQARVDAAEARRLDDDLRVLGLGSRSDAIREGLRLLHRVARDAALAREYDQFYGGAEAPVSDVAAIGDQIAAEVIATHKTR